MIRKIIASAPIAACICALLLTSTPSYAQTQSQMDATAKQAWRKADARLDAFYESYKKHLSPDQVDLFAKANSAWSVYRIAYCRFQASGVEGGSVYPMIYAYCMESEANSRLHDLRDDLVSLCHDDGDLSCPAFVPNNSSKRTR